MCNNLARFQYVAILLHMRKEPTKEKQVPTSRTMGKSLKTSPGPSNPLLKGHSSKSALQEVVDFADLERELRELRLAGY